MITRSTYDRLVDLINKQPTKTVQDRIKFHRLIDLHEAVVKKQQQKEVDK